MPTVKLYPFSLQGSIAEQYGHFFFSVLVPFIALERTCSASTVFEFKLDIGGFKRILDTLFPRREITIVSLEGAGATSYVGDNFEIFVETSRRVRAGKQGREVILDSTEVFDDVVYCHVCPKMKMNARRLSVLQDKYFSYYYTKLPEYKLSAKENTERKRLYLTSLYRELERVRPVVLSFFAEIMAEWPVKRVLRPIILVSRPVCYKFNASVLSAVGGQRRFIWNFTELQRAMETVFGQDMVETVVLEDMNIMEQYAVFRGAKVVVGQHGAGLVNAFFMERGASVVEIAPCYNDRNNFFKNMSRFCELGYVSIRQPGMTPDQTREFFERCDIAESLRESVGRNLAAFYNGEIDVTCPWAVPNEVNMAANSGSVDVGVVIDAVRRVL